LRVDKAIKKKKIMNFDNKLRELASIYKVFLLNEKHD
jgi:hypothetical protein